VIPTPFRITEYADVHLTPVPIANDQNKKGLINVIPFGICAAKGGQPCMPATNNMSWSKPAPDVIVGTGIALLDDSTLPCTQGGRVKIAPSFFHALSSMYSDPSEMFDRMVEMLKGTGENVLAFGKGLLGAGWGLVKFVASAVAFPFKEGYTALTDFDQFKDNWGSRYDSAKAFGEAALEKGEQLYGLATDPEARAAMWAYMSNPDTWEAAFDGVYEAVSEMDNTQIAEFGGQMAFEVLLTVFTGGMGHINKVDKASDAFRAAQALENLDDFADAGRALDNVLPDELIGKIDDIDNVSGGQTIQGSSGSPNGPAYNRGPFNPRNQPNPQNCSECVVNFEASARQGGRTRLTFGDRPTSMPEHMRRLNQVGANPRVISQNGISPMAFQDSAAVVNQLQNQNLNPGSRFTIWGNRGTGEVGHVFAGHVDGAGNIRFFETQTNRSTVNWNDGFENFNIILH